LEEEMDAERAWQSALGQLQMEMPKASFDTWVRDTQIHSYDDGLFTIGVRNAYARDWLESRLSSTVTRLLMGIMNRAVDVSFVVDANGNGETVSDPVLVEERRALPE
jgi:chromosomal replication initiator protein